MTLTTSAPPPVALEGFTSRIPTHLEGRSAWVHAATDINMALMARTVTALVGESGSGKSMLANALCGLLPSGTRVQGSIRIAGREMATATQREWRTLRGRTLGLTAQSGGMSFTPVRTVGSQLVETMRALGVRTTTSALLARVGLGPATADLYPHELSGGMAQRVALAAALVGRPPVLIADEPTAGLDPELAQHVVGLLRSAADDGAAVLLITHDLQLVESTAVADRLAVMYAGRIVESGPCASVLAGASHPYTTALLAALPARGLHPMPGEPPQLTNLADNYDFSDRLSLALRTEEGMYGARS